MYTREIQPAARPFFLFGPRGTGKSTWLKSAYPKAHRFDLLDTGLSLKLSQRPSLLREEVAPLSKETWIVIDEIQKVPALLDEVHFLIENLGYRRFALTGSSARKLKRGASNLLAGRASLKKLYPLTSFEVGYSVPVDSCLRYGHLPMAVNAKSDLEKEEYLTSYVKTYLSEEIKAEGLARDIGSFARFLSTAAIMAGQKVNVSGLARDAQVNRETVRGYFEILEDTLLGTWLPAYRPRAKVKEVSLSKFYWFDVGVLYAAYGGFEQPVPSDWKGVLLEHWVHHELRAYLEYHRVKGSLGYWATPSGSEIDFVWWYGEKTVVMEVKSTENLGSQHLKSIQSFGEEKKKMASYVVYLGTRERKYGRTWALPVYSFLKKLHAGEILGI